MRLETQWHGLERLTYYVLFPMLLIQTLVKADLTRVPVAGVGGALLLSALVMSLLVPGAAAPARPLARRWAGLHLDLPGRDPLADLCRARRLRQSVRRNRAGAGLGGDGRDHPAGQCVQRRVLAHYASPEKQSARAIAMTVVRNPLIWACAIGLVLNVTHIPLPKIWHEVADALGRSSLAIGLLVTGAGLHLEGMFRPSLAASVARVPQADPDAGARGRAGAVVRPFRLQSGDRAACSAVPASSSAYVLARQMGGDAPLLAQIITLQTILAADHHADRDRAGGHDASRRCATSSSKPDRSAPSPPDC